MISVSGIITDQTTGETLPQANVYFSDRAGQILPNHQGSVADENGFYSIEGNGAYITASYVGYSKETKPFKRSLDFELRSGVELKEIEIISKVQKLSKNSNNLIIVAASGLALIIGVLIYKL